MRCDETSLEIIGRDGYRGAERPAAVMLNGQRLEVLEVEDAWIETGIARDSEVVRRFRIRCEGGARFKVAYTEGQGWTGEMLPGPR